MKKFMAKLKMRTLIIILSIVANVFTIGIGIQGMGMIKKSNENMEYMYGYVYWIAMMDEVNANVKEMEANRLKAESEYKSIYEDSIAKNDEIIMKNYNEYMSTENESEEEETYLSNIGTAYSEYYEITVDVMERLKNGELVDQVVKGRLHELEIELNENLVGIVDYLRGWADTDKQDNDALNESNKYIYITSMVVCVFIFIFVSTYIVKTLSRQVKEISFTLEDIAEGNLDIRLEHNNNNEFDEIKEYINRTIESIKNVIKSLKENSSIIDEKAEGLSTVSKEVSSSVENMTLAIENVASGTNEQAADMVKIISVLEDFSNIVVKFTNNIEHLEENSSFILEKANLSTEKMDNLSKDSNELESVVREFTNKLNKLNTSIDEISSITSLINDIAEQTDLLALNAAIESARVGEAGKGFAVVADEIRQLAEQSKASANSINTLIEDVAIETETIMNEGNGVSERLNVSGVEINNTIEFFTEIIKHINELVPKIRELSDAANIINEQKNGIYEKVENSSAIAEEIASSTEEVSASLNQMNSGSKFVSETADNLSDLTNELDKDIRVFKTE